MIVFKLIVWAGGIIAVIALVAALEIIADYLLYGPWEYEDDE